MFFLDDVDQLPIFPTSKSHSYSTVQYEYDEKCGALCIAIYQIQYITHIIYSVITRMIYTFKKSPRF